MTVPGKPRVEYSQQDDDFLCRYLAMFYPGGPWRSRKTFSVMVSQARQYPIAGRHSEQSWHERFKKNSSVFSGRVQRYIAQGIDHELKTASERARSIEKNAAQQSPTVVEGSVNPGPSTSPSAPGTGRKRKRQLVTSDDDDSDEQRGSPTRAVPERNRRMEKRRAETEVDDDAITNVSNSPQKVAPLDVREQYRNRIGSLVRKYKVSPTDLFRILNESHGTSAAFSGQNGEKYWKDVDEILLVKFGF